MLIRDAERSVSRIRHRAAEVNDSLQNGLEIELGGDDECRIVRGKGD